MSQDSKNGRGAVRLWFALTPEERRFLAGILILALIGLTARYLHLRSRRPEPYAMPAANAPMEETP